MPVRIAEAGDSDPRVHARRRRAAYERAAATHEHAAIVHAAAASFLNRVGSRELAARERQASDDETAAAAADHARAAQADSDAQPQIGRAGQYPPGHSTPAE